MSKAGRRHIRKPGRNDPCPCGSGKKFKKCCEGAGHKHNTSDISDDEIKKQFEKIRVLQKQRELQQGMGRTIISILHNGYRLVAVGTRVYWSKEWKTFHDFLFYYIKTILGGDWGTAEIAKP